MFQLMMLSSRSDGMSEPSSDDATSSAVTGSGRYSVIVSHANSSTTAASSTASTISGIFQNFFIWRTSV